jgi:hypothetical protein
MLPEAGSATAVKGARSGLRDCTTRGIAPIDVWEILSAPKFMELPFRRGDAIIRRLGSVAAGAASTLLALASARDLEEGFHEILG